MYLELRRLQLAGENEKTSKAARGARSALPPLWQGRPSVLHAVGRRACLRRFWDRELQVIYLGARQGSVISHEAAGAMAIDYRSSLTIPPHQGYPYVD